MSVLVVLIFLWVQLICMVAAKQASIVLTMLCRDEDVNIRANLPEWLPIVDFFVFVIDSRTTDNTVSTINSILNGTKKKFYIVTHDFVGFGAARTLSLSTAWQKFPQATHVLIADPDWVPGLSSIQLRDLDDFTDVYRFTAFDAVRDGVRNVRKMDWLLRQRAGLSMRYHLHEVLDIGDYIPKVLGWEVREVEKKGTWHSKVGHATSTSADRYKFDLELLYKDLDQYKHDPHTHYYLGITHKSFAAKTSQQAGLHSSEVQQHLDRAIAYFELRVNSMYKEELLEERWGAIIELGIIYYTLRVSTIQYLYFLFITIF